jgi:hypothetical protein
VAGVGFDDRQVADGVEVGVDHRALVDILNLTTGNCFLLKC